MKKNIENIGIVVVFFIMLGYAFVIGIKEATEYSKIDNINVETENQIDDSDIEVSSTEEEVEVNGMTFSVNKKSNFISLVQLIADYDESKQCDSFKKQIYEDFKQYKEHKIFKYIEKKSIKNDGGIDSKESNLDSLYLFVNMYTNEKFEFNNECPQYQEMKKITPRFNEQMVEMAKYLKSFYSYCGYEKYYKEHSNEYGEFAKKVSNIKFNSDYKKALEAFYGIKVPKIEVHINIIGDLETQQWKKNQDNEMNISIPIAVSYEFKNNGQEEEIKNKIGQHIWFNSTNIYQEIKLNSISIPKDIQSKCEQNYGEQISSYNNSEEYIRRGLSNALSIYTLYKYEEEAGNKEMEILKQTGYPFADKLIEKIKSYDGDKEKYKDFEEFIPELLKVFAE